MHSMGSAVRDHALVDWTRRIAAHIRLALGGCTLAVGRQGLAEIERLVDTCYPGVASIEPEELETLLSSREHVLILDARGCDEFDVSHIAGAERIDPELSTADFMKSNCGGLVGKTVVVYCSVGARSALLAQRLQSVMPSVGAYSVYNLRGGIFAWHNAAWPLTSSAGPATTVHPYSRRWSRYLERRS